MNDIYVLMNLNLKKYIGNQQLDHTFLSKSSYITLDIVKENPDIPWNYITMSENPNITINIIRDNPDMKWDHYWLSRNISVTWETVLSNPDIQWYYPALCANPNITWDTIQTNHDKLMDYEFISGNPNITWDIIQANHDKPWDYYELSTNPNITLNIVQANPDKPWNYKSLGMNPSITWDIIDRHPDIEWKYGKLCQNPNISYEMMEDNLLWYFDNMGIASKNINISWRDLYYNDNYKPIDETGNPFSGWNNAMKIQHTFRRWRDDIIIKVSTQVLGDIPINSDTYLTLPIELCVHIAQLSISVPDIGPETHKREYEFRINQYKYGKLNDICGHDFSEDLLIDEKIEKFRKEAISNITPYNKKSVLKYIIDNMNLYVKGIKRSVTGYRKMTRKRLTQYFIECNFYQNIKNKQHVLEEFNKVYDESCQSYEYYYFDDEEKDMIQSIRKHFNIGK